VLALSDLENSRFDHIDQTFSTFLANSQNSYQLPPDALIDDCGTYSQRFEDYWSVTEPKVAGIPGITKEGIARQRKQAEENYERL
jgi:hypothetical protein